MANSLIARFDSANGGFGRAPKFPNEIALELALLKYFKNQDKDMLNMVTKTLDAIAKGGIRDQIGGRFHRYTLDQKWIVPHFEIMLYVNSGLLKNYLHAYQVTGNELYRKVAEDLIDSVNSMFSDQSNGGFYASQDADYSMEDDGDYFTWTVEEVEKALPKEEARVIRLYFGIEEQGEMRENPAKNVLHVTSSPEEISDELDKPVDRIRSLIESGKKHLLEARNDRLQPFIDKNIYTNWNGLMISSYFEAYKILGEGGYRDFAIKSLEFLLEHSYKPGQGMYHCYSEGERKISGLLDDQVQMAYALIDAFEVTGEMKYLEIATELMEFCYRTFWDKRKGGFFDKEEDKNALGMLRTSQKSFQDSPTPASNSVAALTLDRLYYLTNEKEYRDWAEATLKIFAGSAKGYGTSAASYALAVDYHINHPAQVVIIGNKNDDRTDLLQRKALETFRPGKIVVVFDPKKIKSEDLPPVVVPILQATGTDGNPIAYVCAGVICAPPTGDPEEVEMLLRDFGVRKLGISTP